MTYVDLICRAAEVAHTQNGGIGVLLSPIRLTGAEAVALAERARARFGPLVFIAVAAPGAPEVDEGRTCVSSGERAAERATAWRNEARDGAWLLYVSVERQGRAGGLRSTLRAVDEAALRAELLRSPPPPLVGEGWERGHLPAELLVGLEAAGVVDRSSVRALCAYLATVADGDPTEAWARAGQALPQLGLAVDSALSSQTTERLRGNLLWVQEAATGDPRRADAGDPVRAALSEQVRGGGVGSGAIDLATVATAQLAPPNRPRRSAALPGPGGAPSKRPSGPLKEEPPATPPSTPPPPKRGERGATVENRLTDVAPQRADTPIDPATSPPAVDPRRDAPSDGAGKQQRAGPPTRLSREPSSAEPAVPSDADDARRDRSEPSLATSVSSTSPVPISDDRTTSPVSSGAALSPGRPRSGVERPRPARAPALLGWELASVPAGAASLVQQVLDGHGGLRWTLRAASLRGILDAAPAALPRPATIEAIADVGSTEILGRWRAARIALRDGLREAGISTAELARHPGIPIAALDRSALTAQALVEAASAALSALAPDQLHLALACDTVAIEDPLSGDALVVLSPLHPLMVGVALARAGVWKRARSLDEVSRRPVERALAGRAPGPAIWPDPVGDPLLRGADVGGLPVYERRPAGVSDAALAQAAGLLATRYVELHPHAALGLRVLADVERCAPIVEALAAFALEPGRPSVTIHAASVPKISERAGLALATEAIRLLPLPSLAADQEALRSHLEIVVPRGRRANIEEGTVEGGALVAPTRAQITGGWEECVSVLAVPGAAEIDAAVARALARAPRGVLSTPIEVGVSLPLAREGCAWRARIAPEVERPSRGGPASLVDETFAGARVQVLARDMRGAARGLRESLVRVGLRDVRPSRLEQLTRQIARTTGRALTLRGDPMHIEGRLLELTLAERIGDAVVIGLEEILGVLAPGTLATGPLALGAEIGRGRQLRIGVVLPPGARGEALPPELPMLLDWLRRVAEGERLAGVCARALLAEPVWRELARRGQVEGQLARWLHGTAGVEVEVKITVLAEPEHVLVGRTGLRLEGVPVEVLGMDYELLHRALMS